MFRTLALALILTGAALAVRAADVYRYVDAQGGIHYTDTWVPGSTLIKVDHRATSGGLGRVVERCRGAVRVDVPDVIRRQTRVLECQLDRSGRDRAARLGSGQVVGVRGGPVADDLSEHGRASRGV